MAWVALSMSGYTAIPAAASSSRTRMAPFQRHSSLDSGSPNTNMVVLPLSFALRPASPNPFRGETTIRWELPRRVPLTIVIYDVAGRRVRTLVDGVRGPGAGIETWEARTDAGDRVSAGIYFARVRAAGFATTKKIVVVP